MADNAAVIRQFLASKGLTPAQIAGVLGNLQEESGLDPNALNPREQAIGLGQWEGGRRSALQRFAAERGTSETDLQTQLDFLWSELNGPESNALAKLKATSSPADAAAAWDQFYERSAGTTRQQRIDYANQFASGGQLGQTGGGGRAGGFGASVTFSAPSGGGSDVTLPKMDANYYKQVLGVWAGLIPTVPEIGQLVQSAIANHWSNDTILEKFHQTTWYRSHSASARQLIGTQLSDPAQYNNLVGNAQHQIQNLANQMGVNLPGGDWLSKFATQSLMAGWNQDEIKVQLSKQYINGTQGKLPSGDAATNFDNLEKLYQAYGVPYTTDSLNSKVADMLGGKTSLSTYLEQAKLAAKSMYPSLAPQIESGLTVRDVADPYIQTMSKLLEVNPQTVTMNDPMIKRALQGSITTSNGSSTATTTPLWQFEQQVRSDPRWKYTDNANASAADLAMQIGRNWGFE